MDATNNIATDLFYKIRSRFKGLKLGDDAGSITINPEDARFFDFDYNEGDKNIGHVSISLAEPNSMKVYFSNGITEGMDGDQKDNWFGFLKELRKFSKRRMLAFDTRDISKDNLDQRDYAFLSQHTSPKADNDTIVKPVGESTMNESNLYGTKKQSFQKLEDTRLIIKHSKTLADDTEQKPGDRSRNIGALFVENSQGERFKYPFIHLAGARAMQRHVANGGAPYDEIGESIIKMSEEIAQLKSFTGYVVRNDLMNSDTNSVVERSKGQLDALRERVAKIAKQAHYENYISEFQAPEAFDVPDEVMEQFKDQFTVRNFKEDLASVFPVLYRLMKEDEIIGYDDIVEMSGSEESNYHCKDCGDTMHKPTSDCSHDSHDEKGSHWIDDNGNGINDVDESSDPMAAFEAWAMGLGEDSPIQSGSDEEIKEAVSSLSELVNSEFPAGMGGINAIESLKGIIQDGTLFNEIKEQAKQDPNADCRPLIKAWVQENAPEVLEDLDFGDMVDEPAMEDAFDKADRITDPEELNLYGPEDIENNSKLSAEELKDELEGSIYHLMDKASDDFTDNDHIADELGDHFANMHLKADDKTLSCYSAIRDLIDADPSDVYETGKKCLKILGAQEHEDNIRGNKGPRGRPAADAYAGGMESQQEGFMPEEIEGKTEFEFIGDDGESQMGTLHYKAKIEQTEEGGYKAIIDPKSLRGEADPMEDPNGANAKVDDELATMQVVPGGDAHEGAMEFAEEDAQEQIENADTNEGNGHKEQESKNKLNVTEVANFILSMYDRQAGTFPKGPEGVATMVGKKFGEQAEMVARKMVERMAPAQEHGAEELAELERIKTLSGAY